MIARQAAERKSGLRNSHFEGLFLLLAFLPAQLHFCSTLCLLLISPGFSADRFGLAVDFAFVFQQTEGMDFKKALSLTQKIYVCVVPCRRDGEEHIDLEILSVEDEETLREVLCDYWIGKGKRPLKARRVYRPLDLIEENERAQCLDIIMPELDSLSVCRAA